MDLALNNLQWLICHKTKPNQTNYLYVYIDWLLSNLVKLKTIQFLYKDIFSKNSVPH